MKHPDHFLKCTTSFQQFSVNSLRVSKYLTIFKNNVAQKITPSEAKQTISHQKAGVLSVVHSEHPESLLLTTLSPRAH